VERKLGMENASETIGPDWGNQRRTSRPQWRVADPVLIHINSSQPTASWLEPRFGRSFLNCAQFGNEGGCGVL
jgi:hypothetical protein